MASPERRTNHGLFRRLSISVASFALAGCGHGVRPVEPPKRPPVILVSLDTFRADLSTESLRTLSRECVVFDRAYAPIPFTLPSHMSLMTGLYPETHGVVGTNHRLAEGVPTIATMLQSSGYRTAGIYTTDWLAAGFGFGRGFERYEMLSQGLTFADRVTDAALKEAATRPQPTFIFLHYMDAHSDPDTLGGNTLPYYVAPPRRAGLEEALTAYPFCDGEKRCATEFLLEADRRMRQLPREQVRLAHTLYIRGAEALDEELSRLFKGIRDRGDLWDEAHVIVTADHGEEFREHGLFVHAQPYEETSRVPLLWKLPRGQYGGRRIPEVVSLMDVMPTLAELLGISLPTPVQGESLVPLFEDSAVAWSRELVLYDKYDGSRHALVSQGYKLVAREATGQKELYDMQSDPGETRDLATVNPEIVEPLHQRLRKRLWETRVAAETLGRRSRDGLGGDPLDEEARERLRSLGYFP